jgi:hypothetical protein
VEAGRVCRVLQLPQESWPERLIRVSVRQRASAYVSIRQHTLGAAVGRGELAATPPRARLSKKEQTSKRALEHVQKSPAHRRAGRNAPAPARQKSKRALEYVKGSPANACEGDL